MSGGWAEWRFVWRWVPGFVWVQLALIWHPRYWLRRPVWARSRYNGIVTDYGIGPFWLATMRRTV